MSTTPRYDAGMTMKSNRIVTMELELQAFAGHLSASDREVLARKFYRWAKQLYVSAHILRRHAAPASSPWTRPARRPWRPWPGRAAALRDTVPSWPGPAD